MSIIEFRSYAMDSVDMDALKEAEREAEKEAEKAARREAVEEAKREVRKQIAEAQPWCCVCHKPVKPGEAYCIMHKDCAEKDREKLKKADPRLFVPIAAGVIEGIIDDYRKALKELYEHPFDNVKCGHVLRMRKYIRGRDFAILSMGAAEPEKIIRVTEETFMHEMKKKEEREREAFAKELNAEAIKRIEALERQLEELRRANNGKA